MRALLNYYGYYGPNFTVECPTGSGHRATLYEVAREITERLVRIFTIDRRGRRPVFGAAPKFTDDRLWRDHLLFYEYFHGDNGAGIGASHQTGWTGLDRVAASLLRDGVIDGCSESWPLMSAPAAASPAWARRRPGEAERRT